jgi:hypothetical protein
MDDGGWPNAILTPERPSYIVHRRPQALPSMVPPSRRYLCVRPSGTLYPLVKSVPQVIIRLNRAANTCHVVHLSSVVLLRRTLILTFRQRYRYRACIRLRGEQTRFAIGTQP